MDWKHQNNPAYIKDMRAVSLNDEAVDESVCYLTGQQLPPMAVQSTAPATSVDGYNCASVDTTPAIYNTPVLCVPPLPINI